MINNGIVNWKKRFISEVSMPNRQYYGSNVMTKVYHGQTHRHAKKLDARIAFWGKETFYKTLGIYALSDENANLLDINELSLSLQFGEFSEIGMFRIWCFANMKYRKPTRWLYMLNSHRRLFSLPIFISSITQYVYNHKYICLILDGQTNWICSALRTKIW